MKHQKKNRKDRLRRGIYVLPNIFTSLNLFCGFYAIVAAIDQKFVAAAAVIIIAGVFDVLDGKIARATNTSSKFGVEYDSLADVVSFGIAPGVLMYLWALKPLGRIGWLAAFLFMACGALRLARFNTQFGRVSGDYFVGLPIPAAAAMNAATILLWDRVGLGIETNQLFILIMLYVLAFLMVSNIKYLSLKRAELFKRMNFNVLVAIILILIFIAAQPSIALFTMGFLYVVSGPIMLVSRLVGLKRKKSKSSEVDEQQTSL